MIGQMKRDDAKREKNYKMELVNQTFHLAKWEIYDKPIETCFHDNQIYFIPINTCVEQYFMKFACQIKMCFHRKYPNSHDL